jgi:hypothetical protein
MQKRWWWEEMRFMGTGRLHGYVKVWNEPD